MKNYKFGYFVKHFFIAGLINLDIQVLIANLLWRIFKIQYIR